MKNPIPFLTFMASVSVVAFCAIGVASMAGLLSLADPAANPFAVDRSGYAQAGEAARQGMITPPLPARQATAANGKPIEFKHGRQLQIQAKLCNGCGVIESIVRRERRIGTADLAEENMRALIGVAYAATPGTDQFHEKAISYMITVHMDDGSFRTIRESAKPSLRPGIRVRLEDGSLSLVR